MNKKTQDIAYFISFCIEHYKAAKGMTGHDAMNLFVRYNVLDYLNDNFEVLHTQGHRWLVNDIDEFISAEKDQDRD